MARTGTAFTQYADGVDFPLAGSFFPTGTITSGQVCEVETAVSGEGYDRVLRITNATPSTTAFVNHSLGELDDLSLTLVYRWPTAPSTGQQRITAVEADGTDCFRLDHNADGSLLIRGSNATTISAMSSGTGIPVGTWVMDQFYIGNGAAGSARGRRKLTRLDTDAVVVDSGLLTNLTLGSSAVTYDVLQWGFVLTSNASIPHLDLASVAIEDAPAAAGDLTDPWVEAAPPTVVVTGGSTLYLRRDFTGSTPTSPDTSVSHAAVRLSGPDAGAVIETADGIFYLPAPTSGATVYRETTTASPSGLTTTTDITVSAPGGVATGVIRKTYDGTALRG